MMLPINNIWSGNKWKAVCKKHVFLNHSLIPYSTRAAEANQEEIVRLIFEIKAGHDRFDLLSLFMSCDPEGRNVFHYAVKSPRVLEYLLYEFVTVGFISTTMHATCLDN